MYTVKSFENFDSSCGYEVMESSKKNIVSVNSSSCRFCQFSNPKHLKGLKENNSWSGVGERRSGPWRTKRKCPPSGCHHNPFTKAFPAVGFFKISLVDRKYYLSVRNILADCDCI